MYSQDYVWAKVLSYMESRLDAITVSTWFDDTEVVELTDEHLILYATSEFRKAHIMSRCADYIHEALQEIFNSNAKLIVFDQKELTAYKAKNNPKASLDFNPQFTFDSFVVGPSNRFAHGAAIAVSNTPGQV